MGLNKIRLGDYIERSTANNHHLKYGANLISGVNSQGVFAVPKGSQIDLDLAPYKIVNNGAFVYNPTRLNLGSIAYRTEGFCIVSHLYIVFYLNQEGEKIIDPQWLYIYFRREEFQREVTFRNFGSQRPEFSFSDMCDIEVPLPPISIQKKYANIYNAALRNQQCYERGLEDLKKVCDGYMDLLKHNSHNKKVGDLFKEVDSRNNRSEISDVRGINISKQFMPTVADMNEVNLSKYKVVNKGQFAFSGMQTGRDGCIRISLSEEDNPFIISPAYSVFEVSEPSVLPEYIMLWFSRKEVDRLGWFLSDASVRTNLDMDCFYQMDIPVPDIDIQKSIVGVYQAYNIRRFICEKIKAHVKLLCPILIKGSILEADKS